MGIFDALYTGLNGIGAETKSGFEGIEIRLMAGAHEDQPVAVAKDGYIGRRTGGTLTIVAEVAPGLPIYGLDVDGKKNVRLRANQAAKASPLVEGRLYQARVQVEYGEGDTYIDGELKWNSVFFTRYPTNNLRLLKLEPTGKFSIWEIAVISQDGDFFLTVQETYSGFCYRSENGLACPRLNRWPQMIQLMADIIGREGLANLSDILAYREDTQPPPYACTGNQGVVLWWNFAQDYGCIKTERGEAKVHWENAPKRPRLAFLQEGEHVIFAKIGPPVVKKKADGSPGRPTSFQWEAKGVELAA